MIYLDHAATSFPKPEPVLAEMEAFARTACANPGRGGHRLAVGAEAMIGDARRLLARLLGAPRPERIVFTLNASDALNMALKGVVRPGDHVVTSVLEHNSVSRPLNRLERDGRITLTRLAATPEHRLDPDDLRRALARPTRLVAITHASNVTGTIQPIAELARVAHEAGALLLVDASQSAGLVPLDVGSDGVDLLAFTGHKALLGPTGTGGLVVGEGVEVDPWREGGTGGDSASPTQPLELPHRLEGGTPNVLGIAGLRAGVRWLLEREPGAVLAHERRLVGELHRALRDPARFVWPVGPGGGDDRVGLVLVGVPGLSPAELAATLDAHFDIAVRAGLHCAPYAHRHLGTFPDGAVRLSLGWSTTLEDVRRAAAALDEIATA